METKQWFGDFARGAALGVGMLPGASAGTIGIIVNVYDKLIENLAGLRKTFVKSLLALIPILLGWGLASVVLLYGEKKLWDYIPFIIVSFCAGVTLGGMPVITRGIGNDKKLDVKEVLMIAAGLIVGAGIGILSVLAYIFNWFDLEEAFLNPNANWWIYLVTVIVGAIGAIACIIPGISGAMILFIFGLYNPVLEIFIGENSILHNHARLGTGLILTACLAVGAVVGLIGVSGLMKNLLANHRRSTYCVVFGFVSGSIVSMFVNNQIWPEYSDPVKGAWYQYLIGGIVLVATTIIMYLLVRRTKGFEKN